MTSFITATIGREEDRICQENPHEFTKIFDKELFFCGQNINVKGELLFIAGVFCKVFDPCIF